MKKISGEYIAGFVDGEGCFSLKFRIDQKKNKKDGKIRQYFYWGAELAIQLRSDDSNILELIRDTIGCGSINYMKNGEQVRYSVQSAKDNYNKVIPFFKRHNLYGKKKEDFELWSRGVEILIKYRNGTLNIKEGQKGFIKKELSKDDVNELNEIRNKMLQYKSKRSKDFKWGTINN